MKNHQYSLLDNNLVKIEQETKIEKKNNFHRQLLEIKDIHVYISPKNDDIPISLPFNQTSEDFINNYNNDNLPYTTRIFTTNINDNISKIKNNKKINPKVDVSSNLNKYVKNIKNINLNIKNLNDTNTNYSTEYLNTNTNRSNKKSSGKSTVFLTTKSNNNLRFNKNKLNEESLNIKNKHNRQLIDKISNTNDEAYPLTDRIMMTESSAPSKYYFIL